jgi:large subunit ribosomal protein L21
MQYAIIKTGGKQYKVKVGDTLKIEKIEANEGAEIEIKDVLMIFDDDGKNVKMGYPIIKKAKIKAVVLEQGRDKKITVIKYKPKIRYKKKYGHRQPYTKIEIKEISIL